MKKLLTLLLLIGGSHNAWGMEEPKSLGAAEGPLAILSSTNHFLPRNTYIFTRDFKSDDFKLEVGPNYPILKREARSFLDDTYHTSCYIKTNEEGRISIVNLSPLVNVILNSLEAKYTEKIRTLSDARDYCENFHSDYKTISDQRENFHSQAKAAKKSLDSLTWRQRLPGLNTFLSFGVGTGFATGIMAALCWNSSFETKFIVLKQYLGFMAKTAASIPTN